MSQSLEAKYVRLDELEPNPRQPRHDFDDARLKELADSMRESGLLQPILVRKNGSKYMIIAGERRWRAAKLAGLDKVPIIVRGTRDDKVLLESVIENVHRQDLTSVEKENAVYELWHSGAFKTHNELAKALGYHSQSVVDILEAKEFRDRNKSISPSVSTTVIFETRGLDDKTRLQVIEKVEKGELSQRPREGGITEVVKVLRKAPEPLKEAVRTGKIGYERAREAVELYDDVKKKGQPVDDQRVKRHVQELMREEAQDQAQESLRRDLHREVLSGVEAGSLQSFDQRPKHWADELSIDPMPTQIQNWWRWNLKRIGNKFDFYTTHYSQKDIDTFTKTLRAAGVRTLIDVRDTPVSQFHPEYSKQNLANAIRQAGMRYVHLPELGVPREQRSALASSGDWTAFFTWYDTTVAPRIDEAISQAGIAESDRPFAFMCVEVDPEKCHRHRIAAALEKKGLKSIDL